MCRMSGGNPGGRSTDGECFGLLSWAIEHGASGELYADELAVHDDPFDYTLTGKCAYRSAFHYSS